MTAGRTIFLWSVYLIGLGAILVLLPNVFLTLFGFAPTEEVWIRVVGVLVLILAYYCWNASLTNNVEFMRWSVRARASVIVFFIAFVLLGLAKPMLIFFGVVDLAGALLTWRGLKSDQARVSV